MFLLETWKCWREESDISFLAFGLAPLTQCCTGRARATVPVFFTSALFALMLEGQVNARPVAERALQ